nr:DUF2993 domain-containing protein [Homoserinibacter gongjuensis]
MSATAASPVELAPRRRRRAWPWVLVILVVLLAAAAVAADVLVRGIAERVIAQELSSALDVPDDASVEVRIGGGSVLLQALAGGLDRVDVTVDDLTLGPLTGDLTIVAEGVPLDPGAATRELRGRYAIPEEALSALAPEVAGATVDDVHVDGSEVVAGGSAVIFGATLEFGLGLTPRSSTGISRSTPRACGSVPTPSRPSSCAPTRCSGVSPTPSCSSVASASPIACLPRSP